MTEARATSALIGPAARSNRRYAQLQERAARRCRRHPENRRDGVLARSDRPPRPWAPAGERRDLQLDPRIYRTTDAKALAAIQADELGTASNRGHDPAGRADPAAAAHGTASGRGARSGGGSRRRSRPRTEVADDRHRGRAGVPLRNVPFSARRSMKGNSHADFNAGAIAKSSRRGFAPPTNNCGKDPFVLQKSMMNSRRLPTPRTASRGDRGRPKAR